MDASLIPLFSALGGALIGSLTSVGTIMIQSHREAARHRRDFAMQLSIEDRKRAFEMAPKGAPIMPAAVYLDYYIRLVDALEKGPLSPQAIQKISEESDAIVQTFDELNRRRREDL